VARGLGAVNGALSGLAAAQPMFGATAQAAGNASSSTDAASSANVAEEASVAVLRMALDQERLLVNTLA
jgi:hypothetical protein